MKTLLLICLFLSTAQVWGQNVITKTPAAYDPHKNMKVYGGQNLQYFPCDTCPSIAVVKDFGALSKEAKKRWNTAGFFDISDVDRYLSECYADSSYLVTIWEYEPTGWLLNTKDRRSFFGSKESLIQHILTHPNQVFSKFEVIHLKPTFDDFKKWLRKR